MKYSEKNKPLVCMQTQSTCYKGTRKMEVKGVLWHDTGANNPTLKRYVQPSDNAADRAEWLNRLGKNAYGNDWNHIEHQAGLNCWIGKLADGTVTTVQTMPWDYRPWGCGSGSKGSCNNGWIQFEICEDSTNDKAYLEAAYKEACEITAYLCKLYGIDPHGTVDYNGIKVPTILCHQDSCRLGLGSNHSDIYDWFPKYGKSMETARDDVAKLLAGDTAVSQPSVTQPSAPQPTVQYYRVRKSWVDKASQIGAYTVLQNAKNCVDANPGYKVYDEEGNQVYPTVQAPSGSTSDSFRVQVSIDDLRIRKGPGTDYAATGKYTGRGVFTIVETRSGNGSTKGWGRLKSGSGWIALDYAARI